jgi:hypothetical protein
MNTPTPTTSNGRGGLWGSAFILMALVLIQAQNLVGMQPFGNANEAEAGMVSQVGTLTVLTADAGNDDVLVVLDGRSEEVYVYRTDRNGIQLHQRLNIPKLFQDAKANSLGRN